MLPRWIVWKGEITPSTIYKKEEKKIQAGPSRILKGTSPSLMSFYEKVIRPSRRKGRKEKKAGVNTTLTDSSHQGKPNRKRKKSD